ncbi:MAG: hypothetical protein RL023_78 [Candidatus Parcubacteria bacterium]
MTSTLIPKPISPKLIRFTGNAINLSTFPKRRLVINKTSTTSAATKGELTRIPGTRYHNTKIKAVAIRRNFKGLSIETKTKTKTKIYISFCYGFCFVIVYHINHGNISTLHIEGFCSKKAGYSLKIKSKSR